MNNLQVFNFDTAAIRTITKDGEPWFVAKDIATALGYVDADKAIRSHCKKAANLPAEMAGSLDSRPSWRNEKKLTKPIN